MWLRKLLLASIALCALAANGCSDERPGDAANANSGATAPTPDRTTPSALPAEGFKAQLTLPEPPARLRAGQNETVMVRIRNGSDVRWYARGSEINTRPDNKFYIAAGNRWLAAADEKLVTDMDGRYGISKDLAPGEETEVPLVIAAPKTPGEYILEVDLVQEGVAWFSDKGSPTAKTRVTVVK